MSSGIVLKSDFSDYYDGCFDKSDTGLVYSRLTTDNFSKGKSLAYLREKGISTLDIRPVKKFGRTDDKLVIYTNPSLHGGEGKLISTWTEAMYNYPNCLASPFIANTGGVSLKFLQIGSRRFRLMMKNDSDGETLEHGSITSIDELQSEFNFGFALPVFSIDYISCDNEMIAVDFNRVQNLSKFEFYNVMAPDNVVAEIKKAVEKYNII